MIQQESVHKHRKRFWIGAAAVASLVLAVCLWWQTFSVKTYLIRDGDRTLRHNTAETDPAAILEEAGMKPRPAGFTLEQTEEGPVIRLLQRQRITIDYYGEFLETVSTGETVGELLARLKLKVREGDLLSATEDSRTYDRMHLRIARVLQQEQTSTAVIPCNTVYCGDATLPVGTQRILRQGHNGELLRTAEVTYINGAEESRRIISEQVLVQPVDAVLAVGTGLLVPRQEASDRPVVGDGIITLPTGEVLTYSRVISSLATAYCDKGKTATGTQARVGAIAVDPDYIPYGTRMFIMSQDGEYIYGIATAEDCGSKQFIYGTRIDLHYNTRAECIQFGARKCWVYFLG